MVHVPGFSCVAGRGHVLTREQLVLIPDKHLAARDTSALLEWLWSRGWSMSLLELDTERRLRGISAPLRRPNRREQG